MEQLSSTATVNFNISAFRDFGNCIAAVRAAKSAYKEARQAWGLVAVNDERCPAPEILEWLAANLRANIEILSEVTLIAASAQESSLSLAVDTSRLRAISDEHVIGIEKLLEDITNLRPLTLSHETTALARLVAEMPADSRTAEEWATVLSLELTKAKD